MKSPCSPASSRSFLFRLRLTPLLLALAGLLAATASAQTDVSATLETTRAKYGLPALSAIVVKNGRIIAQGATGVRRLGSSALLTLDDRVNVGSCTKFVTATVAARLIDRGLLQWTSKVRDIFPDKVSTYNTAFLDVTLNDILSHRAGVQEQNTFNAYHWNALQNVNGTMVQMRAWVCDAVLTDAPQVPLGTYLYANQGYSVAAAMMERVTGKSWEQLVDEEVYGPLHMTSASLGISFTDDSTTPTGPVGHVMNDAGTALVPQAAYSSAILQHYEASNGPGGYVLCSLADYAKFLTAYADGAKTGTYLTSATRTKMLTPWVAGTSSNSNDYYAHGVFVLPASTQPWASGIALNHDGDIFGEDTLFWGAPAKNLYILIYTNSSIVADASKAAALNDVAVAMINSYSNAAVSGPYLEGPSNAASAKSASAFTLTAKTLPTGVYQLQTSTNFTTWTNSGAAVTANDWTTSFNATISGTTHPYYRIKTVP